MPDLEVESIQAFACAEKGKVRLRKKLIKVGSCFIARTVSDFRKKGVKVRKLWEELLRRVR
jgi:hypothetical protein